MNYHCSSIIGAANTISHGAIWIPGLTNDSFIVYGLYNMLAVVDVVDNNIVCTLQGHSGSISSIRYCKVPSLSSVVLISTSVNKDVICWVRNCYQPLHQWTQYPLHLRIGGSISALSNGIICCDSNDNEIAVFTAGDSSGNIVVFGLFTNQNYSCVELSSFKLPSSQMPNSIHVAFLPSTKVSDNTINRVNGKSQLALFIGSVDSRIHIYIAQQFDLFSTSDERNNSNLFRSVGSLTGHEDWITCLDSAVIHTSVAQELYLATSSQDSKIRIWKIKGIETSSKKLTENEAIDDDDDDDDGAEDIPDDANKGNNDNIDDTIEASEARLTFTVSSGTASSNNSNEYQSFAVTLDSLLIGHEDWVTSVTWMNVNNDQVYSKLRIYSTSMDRNMVIWTPDELAGGIWVPSVRVGDIGGSLGGSVGGNLLGFVWGTLSPNQDSMLGIGYGGSFHLWHNKSISDSTSADRWSPVPFLSGHFGSVNDLAWSGESNNDGYLVTASSDQTCRIWSTALHHNTTKKVERWIEVSRPAIHGYDLNCVVQFPNSYRLYIAGEEKLIRGYDAPKIVLRGLQTLCGLAQKSSTSANNDNNISRVERAFLPELSLTNKAYETMSQQEMIDQEARSVAEIDWLSPPLESQLSDLTLWPEIKKMIGHTNEIMTMAISELPNDCNDADVWIASASKARDAATAQILIWNARTMFLISKLSGHESTVVCLQFSPDSRFLVSSGKDRKLCLYMQCDGFFTMCDQVKNAHKRIVWDCSWTPDSQYIVTGSRDGFVKVWKLRNNDTTAVSLESVCSFSPFDGVAVTAVAVSRYIHNKVDTQSQESANKVTIHSNSDRQDESYKNWIVAIGSDSGNVNVWTINNKGEQPRELLQVPSLYAHGATVKRISWRACDSINNSCQFASVGQDCTVRIHNLTW